MSTLPALELINPHTHQVHHPEGISNVVQETDAAEPKTVDDYRDWVVFSGETLAYLTSGYLPAPIHSVPFLQYKEGTESELRRSMPMFLRADPHAILRPRVITVDHCAKSTNDLVGDDSGNGNGKVFTSSSRGDSLTGQSFTVHHAIGLRPWRLGTGGDY
jgi:hypothetical protein